LPEEDVISYSRGLEFNLAEKLVESLNLMAKENKRVRDRKGANKKLKDLNYTLSCSGRNIINVWRVARSELKLKSYRLPQVFENLFGTRTCLLTDYVLN
jgi:DNA polymerase elongation subunit (family B)